MADTIGQQNPLRYRGYYYDNETGFYYLQSRYYDPVTLRLINSDAFEVLGVQNNLYDKNLFAYCDNNPIVRRDSCGFLWDTIFDVISLGASIVEVVFNPTNVWSWAGLAGDIIDLVPFVTGVGETIKLTNAGRKVIDKADDAKDAVKTVKKIHGNSLNTTKPTVGYALIKNKTNEIMKFGETTRGINRYTKKFYKQNDVYMQILARGSKREMHYWQNQQIINFFKRTGIKPPMNKTFW